MSMTNLAGRVAVVTGGSSGIGYATVELLLQAGAAVALCGRDAARLDGAVAKLRAAYPDAKLYASTCDVLTGAPTRDEATTTEVDVPCAARPSSGWMP